MAKGSPDFERRRERWRRFFRENPRFNREFRRFALKAVASGHPKLSAWLIVNRVRWETDVVQRGETYAVPNMMIAFYARWFMQEYPHLKGFFTIRRMVGEPEEDFRVLTGADE